MDADARFRALWSRHDDFELPSLLPTPCIYAQKFAAWAEELCRTVLKEPHLIAVTHAKLQLLDKYFEWRRFVPKAHQNRLNHGDGHACIFQVFVTAYEQLKVIELSLTPPVFITNVPQLPAQPTYPELELGEIEDDD